MKKSLIRTGFISVLLLSNILFIYKWWMAPDHRHPGPRNEIIDRLQFDENQIVKYDELIRAHRKAIENAQRRLLDQKQRLYSNLEHPFSDSLLNEILNIEGEIEHIHFSHFKEIEKLCKPHQKKHFKELNEEIARMFSPGKKNRHS